ncbi:MAG: SDR family oxidoreductase [Synergistaceae bacterium]|nr:SDR family oxidoreductase [Synergistaceae bacterium]
MTPLIDLTGRKILITGASRGIGREISVLFSKLGAVLCLTARGEDGLRETVSMLEGEGHSYYPFDFSKPEGIADFAEKVCRESGPLDGLVYCTGITKDRPIRMTTPELMEEVLRVNLAAFVELVRQCSKKGRYNPGMRIAALSSVASFFGKKAHLPYSASKAGMDAAVRNMAVELAERGICVNSIAPGMVNTEMYREYLKNNGGAEGAENQRLLRRQYMGIIEPSCIADAAAFLVSPAARFITGITMPVDGGLSSI